MTKHHPPPERPEILRPSQAAAYLGISRRQVYILSETDPRFPRKIVFGPRCVGWRRASLDHWMKQREAAA